MIWRVIKFKRLTSYVIDEYYKEVLNILSLPTDQILKVEKVFVDNSKIYSFSSVQQSLYHYLHNINFKFSESQKISIALQLSGVLNALHVLDPPVYHLHLSSRNVFIEEHHESDLMPEADFIVKVGDVGDIELRRYSKIFSKYEIRNVWSSPEVRIMILIFLMSIWIVSCTYDPLIIFRFLKTQK